MGGGGALTWLGLGGCRHSALHAKPVQRGWGMKGCGVIRGGGGGGFVRIGWRSSPENSGV